MNPNKITVAQMIEALQKYAPDTYLYTFNGDELDPVQCIHPIVVHNRQTFHAIQKGTNGTEYIDNNGKAIDPTDVVIGIY